MPLTAILVGSNFGAYSQSGLTLFHIDIFRFIDQLQPL